jgi:hypothetical protein
MAIEMRSPERSCFFAPPSVLPDIPARGEIYPPLWLRQSLTPATGEIIEECAISPLAGMSGRTEEGNMARRHHQRLREGQA